MTSQRKEQKQELNPQQLRQRRSRIIHDQNKERRDQRKMKEIAKEATQQKNAYMTRLYMVVFTALFVTILSVLNYTRPSFIFKRTKAPPPLYMGTMYPPGLSIDQKLPRFFRTYSIATPANLDARKAVTRVVRSRSALKKGTGNLRVNLRAWDAVSVDMLVKRGVCGNKFEGAFLAGSEERREDMLMWCLLAARITEGYFLGSVDMLDNAFILARRRGMVVQNSDSTLSNAFYLHPRLQEHDSTDVAILPWKVLSWLIFHPEDKEDPSLSRRQLQDYIHELTFAEDKDGQYMVLEQVCQAERPKRALARQCEHGVEACCYFVVSESEGGQVGKSDDDERPSIRPGSSDSNGEERKSSM